MNENEQRAALAYADMKKVLTAKVIRTIEYAFSNSRQQNSRRNFVSDEYKNEQIKDTFLGVLTVLESEIKDELKSSEI